MYKENCDVNGGLENFCDIINKSTLLGPPLHRSDSEERCNISIKPKLDTPGKRLH